MLHGSENGESEAATVESYLRSVLPVSESLFKYLRVVLTR